MVYWIKIDAAEKCDLLIFKFKQYKDLKIVSSVYYGKTLMNGSGLKFNLVKLRPDKHTVGFPSWILSLSMTRPPVIRWHLISTWLSTSQIPFIYC